MLFRVENCKLLPCIYRVILVCVVSTLETALPRNRGSIPGRGEIFLHTKFRPEVGLTQPLVRWVLGDLASRAKRPNCERDHLLPSSAEVKKCVEPNLHSPYFFIVCTVATSRPAFTPACLVPRASHRTLQQAGLTDFDQTRVRTEFFYPLAGVIDAY
jgi:hypothetical protein